MWNMKGSQQAWRICRNCLHMNMYIHTYTQTKHMHKERWDRTGQKQRKIEETRVCSRLKIVQANWKRVSPALQEQSRSTASDIYRFFFFFKQDFLTQPLFVFRCLQKSYVHWHQLADASTLIFSLSVRSSIQSHRNYCFSLHQLAFSSAQISLLFLTLMSPYNKPEISSWKKANEFLSSVLHGLSTFLLP